mgnify:FL=1
MKKKNFFNYFLSEEGSVESSLVLIPSLLLFLIVIQLAFSIYDREAKQLKTQEYARIVGLEGYSSENVNFAKNNQIATTFVPMPSGKILVVTHSLNRLKLITQLLIPFQSSIPISVFGFAISEEKNT